MCSFSFKRKCDTKKKGTEKMAKNALCNLSGEKLTCAINQYKKDNPVIVRKKFQMKDTWFRRDEPDIEVFHIDVGFDVEMYVLLLVIVAVAVFFIYKIGCAISHVRFKLRRKS